MIQQTHVKTGNQLIKEPQAIFISVEKITAALHSLSKNIVEYLHFTFNNINSTCGLICSLKESLLIIYFYFSRTVTEDNDMAFNDQEN